MVTSTSTEGTMVTSTSTEGNLKIIQKRMIVYIIRLCCQNVSQTRLKAVVCPVSDIICKDTLANPFINFRTTLRVRYGCCVT